MTSSANQIVPKLSLHGCCPLNAAGDDVPEHSLCSGAKFRLLSKGSVAPNSHHADKTLPLIFNGLCRKEEGHWMHISWFGLKKALLSIVTVLKREKIETSPKVETHCEQ